MSRKKDDQTSTSRTNANTSMRMLGTDDVAIKSSSHGNRNTTSVKDKVMEGSGSNVSDSPVMEGIVQLLNQVNRQYQEKSNLQGLHHSHLLTLLILLILIIHYYIK